MDTLLTNFKSLFAEVADLRRAAELIEWDERVCMPSGGAAIHGEMQATLRRLAHEAFTRDEMGKSIQALVRGADPSSDMGRLAAVASRDYEKATRVPPSFVAELAHAVSSSQHAWELARANDDFAAFAPHLQRVLDLKRQYVTFFPPSVHPYDILLDDCEPGMKTSEVQSLFATLRPRQVALIKAIAARPSIDDSCLSGSYSEADMMGFAVDVAGGFGFDWSRGRQDKSVHPFATGIGTDDVRITTRWVERQPFSLLFGTMHETGHALYEQGVSRSHHRTPLEGGTSLGVHESQSRLWENIIGRSRGFCQHVFPALEARFASQLSGVSLEQFHRAINCVQPSLIRVEADEATYNLHIMLRVELEIALVEGRAAVRDLPELWRNGMRDYLGLVPPTDALGVLQDVHWSAGLFGYFSTYTLGNVIAAQLWERFGALNPDRDAQVARGEFAPLLSWLRREVHQHGRAYRAQELVERITGTRIDSAPYLHYLEHKYGELYGL
jgi:carboxypeptidase Taq